MSLDASQYSWFELRSMLEEGRPLILSVGSFEQHGPHLPLSTDALIARELAERVANRVDGLVLPILTYGAPSRPRSGGGDIFPAPAVRLPTLLHMIEEIVEGAIEHGAKLLVVMSWHFENGAVLWDALRPPLLDSGAKAILFDAPWDFIEQEFLDELFPDVEPNWPADHAGRLETAIMRYLDALIAEPPEAVPFVPRFKYDVLPTPVDSVPETGVVHDARAVSAETGERCVNAMIDGMVAAIEDERGR